MVWKEDDHETSDVPCGSAACAALGSAQPTIAADDVAALYTEAKREGGSVTWWASNYPKAVLDQLVTEFERTYPGIHVSVTKMTAGPLGQRVSGDLDAGVPSVDVVHISEIKFLQEWKKRRALAAWVPPDADRIVSAFRTMDPDHTYHLGGLSFIVLNYGPGAGAPQKWIDLLDSKYAGKVAVGNPAFSGYVTSWAIVMASKYGPAFFKQLAANKPAISHSIFDVVDAVVAGSAQIGAGVDGLAAQARAQGKAITIAFPSDDAVLAVSAAAVLRTRRTRMGRGC